jgi:hypothetical protein
LSTEETWTGDDDARAGPPSRAAKPTTAAIAKSPGPIRLLDRFISSFIVRLAPPLEGQW